METHTDAPEPIVLAFSDGRRYTLKPEITRHIWKEVAQGHYSSPEEYITLALDAYFAIPSNPAR
ncbi:MAG TPA: hypothetical protein VFA65_02195 [Bryobacteraceae bacterium]|nr:hypothetical protein [Bryobacteraceae bacterium]